MEIEQLAELRALWARFEGDPPGIEQFALWAEENKYDLMRQAVIKTAGKVMALQGRMDVPRRRGYCARIMDDWHLNPQPLPKVKP